MTIEFKGNVDGKTKKFIINQLNKIPIIIASVLAVIIIGAFALFYFVGKMDLLIFCGAIVVALTLVAIMVFAKPASRPNMYNEHVIISDTLVSWLSSDSYREKDISGVLYVEVYAEFYHIVFEDADDCICQKRLLTQGTLDDFETLFNNKLIKTN